MQDMMHCLNPSVLERQKFHLQQQQDMIINNLSIESFFSHPSEGLGGDDWPNLTSTPQFAIDISPPTTTTTTAISNSTSSIQIGKENTITASSKKRKSPIVASDDKWKRMKGDHGSEGEKQRGNKREDSGNCSKENTNKKPDYIHVRARRGQATDSHSLAERVRRERISERMKYLQGLVPGCNKITGKAGMLDEIINYVQSLQRQVEFLSMKLAAVNPRLEFNTEALISKEANLSCHSNISMLRMASEMVDPSFLQFNSMQQAEAASCGLDMAVSPAELALRRTISAPLPSPEPFLDSCFNVQRTSSGWDNELHKLCAQAFPFPSLQGNILSNNMKAEM